mgnify:CR=1 FL=1
MRNVARMLQQEIMRLARKETRAAIQPLAAVLRERKKQIRELQEQVVRLNRQCKALAAALPKNLAPPKPEEEAEGARLRITSKGMKSLRKRLRLTQIEFAKLLRVSPQAVWKWEHHSGAIRAQSRTRQTLLQVRQMGAKEAQDHLKNLK